MSKQSFLFSHIFVRWNIRVPGCRSTTICFRQRFCGLSGAAFGFSLFDRRRPLRNVLSRDISYGCAWVVSLIFLFCKPKVVSRGGAGHVSYACPEGRLLYRTCVLYFSYTCPICFRGGTGHAGHAGQTAQTAGPQDRV